MGMRVDYARGDCAPSEIDDMGLRPNQNAHVAVGTHRLDGVAADCKRLRDAVIYILSMYPPVHQDEIGGGIASESVRVERERDRKLGDAQQNEASTNDRYSHPDNFPVLASITVF